MHLFIEPSFRDLKTNNLRIVVLCRISFQEGQVLSINTVEGKMTFQFYYPKVLDVVALLFNIFKGYEHVLYL